MGFFIAINGRVYKERWDNGWIPRLDIENNHFETRNDAWFKAYELEEQHPRIFYGKPTCKAGLRQYANGDTEATYRKRT